MRETDTRADTSDPYELAEGQIAGHRWTDPTSKVFAMLHLNFRRLGLAYIPSVNHVSRVS